MCLLACCGTKNLARECWDKIVKAGARKVHIDIQQVFCIMQFLCSMDKRRGSSITFTINVRVFKLNTWNFLLVENILLANLVEKSRKFNSIVESQKLFLFFFILSP